jgi:hypothetical protein
LSPRLLRLSPLYLRLLRLLRLLRPLRPLRLLRLLCPSPLYPRRPPMR